jgi:hypothetical protein
VGEFAQNAHSDPPPDWICAMEAAEAQSWVAVDVLLASACCELRVGEMVRGDHFNMFEAMSAVEIGHMKMDTTAVPACSLDAELELAGKSFPPAALTPATQVAVLDRLLLLEASHYFMAVPLASSVYSYLYMMRPEPLAGAAARFRAVCIL